MGQTSAIEPPSAAETAGPDWTRVSFEVPCPLCGVDLHGASDARCPACQLRFDWGRVLPLEQLRCRTCEYRLFGLTEPRCPECGEPFEWQEVLRRARQHRVELFENRWWDEPAPALLRTWWLAAFRPARLWAAYAGAGRPRVAPLLLLIALQGLVFAQGWHLVALAADTLMNALADWTDAQARFIYSFRPARGFRSGMAAWQVMTFLSLLAFIQSNRRHRAGWRDILRVYAHATVFASMMPAVWCLLEMFVDASILVTPRAIPVTRALYDPLQLGVFLLGIVVTWAHIAIGYRRHLHMPHAAALAGLAMLLGYLLAQLVLIYA